MTDATCATEIVIPDLKLKKHLPLDETVEVDLRALPRGVHDFGCGMSMMVGGKAPKK